MKIEKFVKVSKDKYKVYLEDKSNIVLYEDVIINNNLLIKKNIEEEDIINFQKQNNEVLAYSNALKYISIKMRSKKEVTEYLNKKQISKNIIDNIIKKLEKEGLLNDYNYAKAFVHDQINLSLYGPNKIKNNLINNNIDIKIIDEVIEGIDNKIIEEKLIKLINKQLKIKKGSSNEIKIKLLNYFINLGYDKNMIINKLNNINIETDLNKMKKEYDKYYNKYKNKYSGNELRYFILNKMYQKGYSKEELSNIKEEQ